MLTIMLSLAIEGPHAHHDVALVDDVLVIDTRWSPATIARGHDAVALAVPLPADTKLAGAAAVRDDEDRIVAVLFDGSEPPRLQTELPLATARDEGVLPIPVLDGCGVQRVSLDTNLGFRPDPALEMVTHLGHHVAPAIRRRAIDRELGRAPLGSYYATTDAIAREHGMHGELELRADERSRTALGVAVLFVVVCGAGTIAYRRSRHRAEAERADQLLAAEFDGLERDTT
jgi:hypothetical protein